MKQFYIAVLIFLGVQNYCAGQSAVSEVPVVGKQMPDFTLSNITHYKSKSAKLSDFKGKWLVLDFWNMTCSSCVRSFPEADHLNNVFKNQLTWMMVGLNDKKYNKGIESLYEKLAKARGLTMPAAYDSVLFDRWNGVGLPTIFIIDPNGKLYARTSGFFMTEGLVRRIIAGEKISFHQGSLGMAEFDLSRFDQFADSNKLMYSSVLTKWQGQTQHITSSVTLDQHRGSTQWSLSMATLTMLYHYAFFDEIYLMWSDSLYGKVSLLPKLEMKNSTLFDYSYGLDMGKGTYDYYLRLPYKATAPQVREILKAELNNAFGYDAHIEKRPTRIWKLIVTDSSKAKLKTKGGAKYQPYECTAFGFTLRNVSPGTLLSYLSSYIAGYEPFVNYIDETGFKTNVDFQIETDMTDLKAIKRELIKSGLDLVKDYKKMDVLVIGDAERSKIK